MIANSFHAAKAARSSLNKENIVAQEKPHEDSPAGQISVPVPVIPISYYSTTHGALPKKAPRPRPKKQAWKKQNHSGLSKGTTAARSNVNKPAKPSTRSPADAKLATLARDIIASLSNEGSPVSSGMDPSAVAAPSATTSELLASASAQLKGHDAKAHLQRVRFSDL